MNPCKNLCYIFHIKGGTLLCSILLSFAWSGSLASNTRKPLQPWWRQDSDTGLWYITTKRSYQQVELVQFIVSFINTIIIWLFSTGRFFPYQALTYSIGSHKWIIRLWETCCFCFLIIKMAIACYMLLLWSKRDPEKQKIIWKLQPFFF